jgi:hypothetical protein
MSLPVVVFGQDPGVLTNIPVFCKKLNYMEPAALFRGI